MEEVQEEVREIKSENEEVEGNISGVDEMTCATPLSHALQCVNHDDTNLTNKRIAHSRVNVQL